MEGVKRIETKKDYQMYVDKVTPNSHTAYNILKAFMVGGGICLIGQFINDFWSSRGLAEDDASAATSISLIFIGIFLTAFNIYSKIGKFAGAGSIVPITGFANSIASPAIEFKSEGLVLGVGAKLFQIAGPVLVYRYQYFHGDWPFVLYFWQWTRRLNHGRKKNRTTNKKTK